MKEEKEMRRKFDDKIKRDGEKPVTEKAKEFVGLFTLPSNPKAAQKKEGETVKE